MLNLTKNHRYICRSYSKFNQNNAYYKIMNIEKRINYMINHTQNKKIKNDFTKELKIIQHEIVQVKKELYDENKLDNNSEYYYFFF